MFGEDIWIPGGKPTNNQLLLGAVGEWLARPESSTRRRCVRPSAEVATNKRRAGRYGRGD